MNTIGQRIKVLRKERSITQKKLASLLGVTPVAVSQWERGETEPKIKNLRVLKDIFNVNFEWLCLGFVSSSISSHAESLCISIPYLDLTNETKEPKYLSIDLNIVDRNVVKNSVCIQVQGDSMEPLFSDETITLVDTTNKDIRDGKFYAINQNGVVSIKQLSYTASGIKMRHYNKNYEDQNYTFQEFSKVQLLGRVWLNLSFR